MKMVAWLKMNARTRPVFKELTDEFVQLHSKEPNNIMVRLARIAGLPEGINPVDPRILRIFGVKDSESCN